MHRFRIVAFCVFVTVLAAAAAGCGGGDDEAQSTTTPDAVSTSAGQPPNPPPQPAPVDETPTPEPSATPEPTNTPEPSPTPAELTFDAANSGSGESLPPSTGPFGIKYAEAAADWAPSQDRLLIWAVVYIGINERPSATAWLINQFRAPGEGSTPITANISTGVNWKGVLAGNGAAGTGAAITITMTVLEDGRVIATEPVHSTEQRESALTIGGFDDIGRADADMQVAVVPGRVYELRLTATCEAFSGLLGVVTHCVFGPSDTYDDGYIEWETRSILFSP